MLGKECTWVDSLFLGHWVGSRIQENGRINLSKEEERLLPWEEPQISLGGWKYGLGLCGEVKCPNPSSPNSNAISSIVFLESPTRADPSLAQYLWTFYL